MELKDILTLIVAIYAAAVATILGIRELKREKREVNLFLEISIKSKFFVGARIVIVNTGHRPVTITKL